MARLPPAAGPGRLTTRDVRLTAQRRSTPFAKPQRACITPAPATLAACPHRIRPICGILAVSPAWTSWQSPAPANTITDLMRDSWPPLAGPPAEDLPGGTDVELTGAAQGEPDVPVHVG